MFGFGPLGRLSDGEKKIVISFLAIGAFGAILAAEVASSLTADPILLRRIDVLSLWTLIAGAVGAGIGFLLCYRTYLGGHGLFGWIRAFCGGVMISGIGAVIGGTLILPYYGTMFAPFNLIITLIEIPALAAIWAAMFVCLHKLVQTWQTERDSIFYAFESADPR